ncbi:MAG: hypothetical protein WCI05_11865 [Myxococcales bacterium]
MLDDAHIALMPSRALVAELRELARNDPRIYEITTARPGTPDPAALVTLTNDAGEITFQMIDLPVPGAAGRLYVGQLPGRASNLAGELDALVAFGIRHVFSLLPAIDLADPYRVPTYIEEARARFADRFFSVDVIDYEAPPDDVPFEAALNAAHRALSAGDKVYVHCGAGCGRAGMFASCLLVDTGAEPIDAIKQFRAIRGCGPESTDQVAYVVRHARRRAMTG